MTRRHAICLRRFLEQLSEGVDEVDFHSALADVSSQPDLLAFAYLSLPPRPGDKPRLISNYPAPWTARYLEHQYQSIDPVIVRARVGGCPFQMPMDWQDRCSYDFTAHLTSSG
ncbi:MAG: hypothetical protein EOS57_00660 [Mesorhizobium sp.]|nr:hypothetical protein EJ078_09410 [Mesorhizobium sp. M1A.F.Ca.IN.022.06.1.1]RUV77493.1 hypothetical protein EOA78_00040 [Mesorhizobium sp. M5C.F.Cr.IN.023.01.1.1]RWD23347.1 MAG: hypothetical protein EOS57_00660 [Mesorhizobium sp.]